MCNFFSGIVQRGTSNVISSPALTDSHDEIIEAHRELLGMADLREHDPYNPPCARFEYTHPKGKLWDVDGYVLKADEAIVPIWWESIADEVESQCKSIVSRMIVSDHRKLLLGGCWILVGDSVVDKAVNARIIGMWDSARVTMCTSSQCCMLHDSSQVTLHSSSWAVLTDSSQCRLYDWSQARLHDSSHAKLYGSSQAELYSWSWATLRESSQARLHDSSQATLFGSSHAELYGSSQATLYGSSQATPGSSSSELIRIIDRRGDKYE